MALMTEDRTDSTSATARPRLVTTGEAAEMIGYGLNYRDIRNMVKAGELPFVQLRERAWYKIPLEAVLAKRAELDRSAGVEPQRTAGESSDTQ